MSNRDGSRRVDLFIPFEGVKGRIETITFEAPVLDTLARWDNGMILGPLALMAELSGLSESELGMIRFPDAQRVIEEFMFHIPIGIRDSIAANGFKFAPSTLQPQREVPVEPGPEPEHNDEGVDDADLGLDGGIGG